MIKLKRHEERLLRSKVTSVGMNVTSRGRRATWFNHVSARYIAQNISSNTRKYNMQDILPLVEEEIQLAKMEALLNA